MKFLIKIPKGTIVRAHAEGKDPISDFEDTNPQNCTMSFEHPDLQVTAAPVGAALAQVKFNQWNESLPANERAEYLSGELPSQAIDAIRIFGNRGYLEGYLQALKDIGINTNV